MTATRDTERLIRAFLDEGVTELPERVFDAVRSDIDRTHQRVVIGPWRTPDMNTFAKFATAAAAVLVVAIVGYNLLPGDTGTGGTPTASASPSRSPSLSPSPSTATSVPPEPTPIEGAIPPAGALKLGSHAFSQNGVGFSLDIATSGWVSSGIAVKPDGGTMEKGIKGTSGAGWILLWSIDGVYADPCGHVTAPVKTSAANLAAAVAGIPDVEVVTPPEDTTLGGRPATHVAIRIPDDIPCIPSEFLLWYDSVSCDGAFPCFRWATSLGETHQVWIVVVDGKRVWIEAETYKGATPEIEQEVQAIIESIQFE